MRITRKRMVGYGFFAAILAMTIYAATIPEVSALEVCRLPFLCYNISMSTLTFSDQRPDETVQFVFRRHWLTIKRGFLLSCALLLLGFIPIFAWPNNPAMLWCFFVALALSAFTLGYFYLLWHFSIFIITNQRIRQISQKSLFKKSVVDLSLAKVESVSMTIPGFFATLLNYGTILIQTSAGVLTISTVKSPKKIHAKLESVLKDFEDTN